MGRFAYVAVFLEENGKLQVCRCLHILDVESYSSQNAGAALVELYEFNEIEVAERFCCKFSDEEYLEEYVRSSNPSLINIKSFVVPFVFVTRNMVSGDRKRYFEMVVHHDHHPYEGARREMINLMHSMNESMLLEADNFSTLDFPDDQTDIGGSGKPAPTSPKIPPRTPGEEKEWPSH